MGSTVASLLASLELDPRLVVVERNREILRDRNAFADIELTSADTIEIVHFVGGG
jgi:thiamine biosynthesis protein ThiS